MDSTTNANRQLLQEIFAGLARGDSKRFTESMDDDLCWTVTGTNAWSGSYRGKQAVMNELMRPLFANFADQYVNTAHRFIADGEWVVVECQGRVKTTTSKRYDNKYCWVCRVEGGRLKEVIEYMDTELVARTLDR